MTSSVFHKIARCGAARRECFLWGSGWRLVSYAVLVTLTLVCSGAAQTQTSGSGENWQVVLAAGDDAQPVFDNATREMTRRLAAGGIPIEHIHRLSASATELGGKVEQAFADVLLRRIAELPTKPGDRCLIFLTSHGERGAGLWLARSNRALSPDELAGALSRGCAAVPTIVIVSACYSGSFAAGKMAKPNRIILTAARADRPSFGCQAHRTYNFFDECLLGLLPQSTTWRAVFNGADRCVRRMEQALGMRPSEPQAYFGGTVAALKLGF
jgi:Peptidase C13 family